MRHAPFLPVALLASLLSATAGPARAVVPGQVDDFEDGTTQGWTASLLGSTHPAPPTNATGGGPGGSEDNYLLVTSFGGSGPGSRLVALNPVQWAGDYHGQDIRIVRMRLRNLGTTDLQIRLLFEDPLVGPPTNVALTAASQPLPAGGGWVTAEFPIAPSDLIAVSGTAEAALSSATVLRIFHGTAAVFPPDPIAGMLGIDMIEAIGDPLPAASANWGRIKRAFR